MTRSSLAERNIRWSQLQERAAGEAPVAGTVRRGSGAPALPAVKSPWTPQSSPAPVLGHPYNPFDGLAGEWRLALAESWKADRVGTVLQGSAKATDVVEVGGDVVETVTDAVHLETASEAVHNAMQPVTKVSEALDAITFIWEAGKVLRNDEAPLDRKMTALNNATFSTLVAAGTIFPGPCGPMLIAGTIGLAGTEIINRLARRNKPEPSRPEGNE